MAYDHTQHGPLVMLLGLTGAALLVGAWVLRAAAPASLILSAVAFLVLALTFCFAYLRVSDEGRFLRVRFGPFPVFGCRVAYDQIREVRRARSSVLDGWGVHWVPGRGWTYNLWGFDCVEVQLARATVRIGTDDIDGLCEFLSGKVQESHGDNPRG